MTTDTIPKEKVVVALWRLAERARCFDCLAFSPDVLRDHMLAGIREESRELGIEEFCGIAIKVDPKLAKDEFRIEHRR